MEPTLSEHIERLIVAMKQEADPVKARSMEAYLKDKFTCFGIPSPIRNEIQRAWFASLKPYAIDHFDLAVQLWAQEERELHYVAIDYLNKIPKKSIQREDWRSLEALLVTHSWWESVDGLASNYVGAYFSKFPEQKNVVIERWRRSDNFWLNRTCLIFQLKYKDAVDFDLLKGLICQFQPNNEFFIQKAIGWSLRQYSKYNPEAVRSFVDEIELKGLARREALKYLS